MQPLITQLPEVGAGKYTVTNIKHLAQKCGHYATENCV